MSYTDRLGRRGQCFVVSELAAVGGVSGWLVARAVTEVTHDDGLLVPILKTKKNTTLYAIRPPPTDLHSYHEDSIQ